MRTFLYKLAIFISVVLTLQLLKTMFFDSTSEINRLNNGIKDKAQVVYFGDSTAKVYGKDEYKVGSIVSLLRDMQPGIGICDIVSSSYGLDVYLAYCKYIERKKYHPKAMIIPINMRSFSPEWDKRPEYQFLPDKALLGGEFLGFFYKPLSVFKYSPGAITRDEFNNSLVFNGDAPVGKVKDYDYHNYRGYSQEGERKLFIFDYMYALKESHRKLQSMVSIARAMNKDGIKVIFYITPIDCDNGEKFLPGQFLKRLRANTSLIAHMLEKEGLEVLDLSTGLRAEYFSYNFPTICEHMNADGVRSVAQEINKRLMPALHQR